MPKLLLTSLALGVLATMVIANSAAATTFTIPAPAPTAPASGMNVLASWRAARTPLGLSPERPSSIKAAAPLTTPAAMLVPDRRMYALTPVPATTNAPTPSQILVLDFICSPLAAHCLARGGNLRCRLRASPVTRAKF